MNDGIFWFFYSNVEAIRNFLVYTPVAGALLIRYTNKLNFR